MANALYTQGKMHFLAGDLDLDANDIKLVFIDEDDDAPVLATDDALDDITGAARVATSGNFAGKTTTDGTFDATDVTIATVAGDEFESITTYKDSGAEATSFLICNHDTGTGLPCTPNGGDITISWNASGLFTL